MAGITTDRDIPQEPGPLDHQFLEKRGKTPSPPLKNRVMVADPNQRTVEVQSKKSVTNDPDYTSIQLPSRQKIVTIFVDPETNSPTLNNARKDGHSNEFLAQFQLPGGLYNQILRSLGKLSTLYVRKVEPWSDTSSQQSAIVSPNGTAAAVDR